MLMFAKSISQAETIARPVDTDVISVNGWAPLGLVARKIGKHPATLKRWAKRGTIEAKLIRGVYHVKAAEIESMFA
jgi:hypothetical protein